MSSENDLNNKIFADDEDDIQALQKAIEDVENGRVISFDSAMAEITAKHNISFEVENNEI
ncbi:MAG TPA: hypothetical protein PKY59_25050 [Pyrinomonadaceae bacterium]|nr:hypothetical protein [Pyrinomonadaceae bacterium]